MNNVWANSSNEYHIRDASNLNDLLPKGIYEVTVNPMTGEIYLVKTQEKFTFNYKVYGIEDNFIKRVHTTWMNTKGNLGILLNGIKGTGKTVTAELICGVIDLPVLLVNRQLGTGLGSFLDEIKQDVILFFDEFEKNYTYDEESGQKNHSLLSIMDGVSSKEYRRMFLLTTNKVEVEPNLLERPSRVRYVKEFADLSVPIITEIVDDLLLQKELRAQVIKFIATLNIITVDIVKSIITEVNIHKEDPIAFSSFFNVKQKRSKFDVYWDEAPPGDDGKVNKDSAWQYYSNISPEYLLNADIPEKEKVGNDLYVNGRNMGTIQKVANDGAVAVSKYVTLSPGGKSVKVMHNFKIVPVETYHHKFSAYSF